jgi:hypothetical protein
MRALHTVVIAVALALALVNAGLVAAQPTPPDPADESTADDRTPPRLSYVDGQVSFWRPGAPEWVAAQVNTALAPGDELSTGSPGNLEVQVGPRAYLRAWAGTVVGLVNQEPDFLQLKVTSGYASLDLRSLDPGRTVELDTPNAAFTIEQPGYYRVYVNGDRTSFTSRRGGRAIVTPANGQAASIAASEEVVIEGGESPRVLSYAAPPLDEWDRWNYARTDYLADAVSARYVSAGVYGVSDLDRHGRWRVVPEYGSVWVPTAVPAGWVPYSTGSWTWDPHFGWTWVDTAPWGWAPYHYGRWVYVDRYWAWAPGPVVVRPAYAPALVAFFGGSPGVSVRVGWVALGWGEPVIPWWGRPRFVGVPWWGGWGGPRVVNNVVINRTTVVNVQNINVYRNVNVHNAVVAVDHRRFGRGPVASARVAHVDPRGLEPVRGRLDVQPVAASLAPTTVRGARPPDERLARPVVATRAPQSRGDVPVAESSKRGGPAEVTPAPRLVPPPRERNAAVESPRPPFGQGRSERPQPPPPPRLGGAPPRTPEPATSPSRQAPSPARREQGAAAVREPSASPGREPRATTPVPSTPPAITPREPRGTAPAPQPSRASRPASPATSPSPSASRRMEAPRHEAPRMEAPRPQARPLPGEAASRMSPGRGEPRPGRGDADRSNGQRNGGDTRKARD